MPLYLQSFCWLGHRLVGPLGTCSLCHGSPFWVPPWLWPGSQPRMPALALAKSCFHIRKTRVGWSRRSPCSPLSFAHLSLLMALLCFKEFSSTEGAMVKQNLFSFCASHPEVTFSIPVAACFPSALSLAGLLEWGRVLFCGSWCQYVNLVFAS